LAYWLLRILEVKSTSGRIADALAFKTKRKVSQDTFRCHVETEDEDVTAERRRVEEIITSPNGSTVAVVHNLCKDFPNSKRGRFESKVKAVVSDLTFVVKEGEVFGLLGPNGAGKSTSLNMMIAEVNPSQGVVRSAYIARWC
jgi:ABC-type glutathione transport system ATPase component